MKITRKQAEAAGLAIPGAKRPRQDAPDDRLARTLFLEACKAHGLPVPQEEYLWGPDAPPDPKTGKARRWRFDWLFEALVAVERIGGVWTQGHHSRGQDQIDDMVRRNEAQILGYVVLEFTPQQIESGEAFEVIRRALGALEEQS